MERVMLIENATSVAMVTAKSGGLLTTCYERRMRLFICSMVLSFSLHVDAQEFVDRGVVGSGTLFDAVRGTDTVHLLGSRYYQLDRDGTVLADEAQGAALPGGPFGFPPGLAVAADGAVHTVTRVGGSVAGGSRLRYRRRNAAGEWDRDYEYAGVDPRNYIVSVAAVGPEVLLTSTSISNGVWGPVTIWSAGASAATRIGAIDDIWRADDGARLRSSATRFFLAAGLPNPGGRANVLQGTDGAALVASSVSRHEQGSDRRGVVDLYVDASGNAHLTYGTSQEVYYARYRPDGTREGSDVRVAGSLGAWRLSIGLSAVAASDDGQSVLALVLRPGSSDANDAAVQWTLSVDGGATWPAPQDLGVRVDTTEGRVRPRVVYLPGRFAVLFGEDGSREIQMMTLDVLTDDDMDGFNSDVDCDDSDSAINPDAAEVCTDGVDNNCNEQIDGADPECVVSGEDAGAGIDASVGDAGVPIDASMARDVGETDAMSRDAQRGDAGSPTLTSGCSCRLAPAPRHGEWFLLWALSFMLYVRRRRSKAG